VRCEARYTGGVIKWRPSTEGEPDPHLRGPGINNFDFALFSKRRINERFGLIQVRAAAQVR
jgi:hypothetical protein